MGVAISRGLLRLHKCDYLLRDTIQGRLMLKELRYSVEIISNKTLQCASCGFYLTFIFVSFQTLMREASNVLYTALDSRAFFKSVTIVVPSSWRDSKCQTIIRPPRGGTPYRNADIHISKR